MPKLPLYYTFGNHMHWVDMQWLWGYDVLPGSVRDMLTLCREAGVMGNVNFDAIGYEKMAAECPQALADLRAAVQDGLIEPVGCSYGQPYGLFHGGESNIRQLTYGVRATMRHLGVRPRTFWEEEFYFFPQLPQLLASAGYTGACLFFQWTWHTPEVPKEPHALILWEGIDGTQLSTLPRNGLNVHQWPEDFDGLLDPIAGKDAELPPAVVQWLELMPSKDWMCRSELLMPRLKELMSDSRFEVRARTAHALIGELTEQSRRTGTVTPIRAYSIDDVWHGMTLGKNLDAHPRASAATESNIRAAESASSLASLFGRPYASWDAYPTWELEEAMRLTLAAQHHDNHECEGLCGSVGHEQFRTAQWMVSEVGARARWLITRRSGRSDASAVMNPVGWARTVHNGTPLDNEFAESVPPFGYSRPTIRGNPPMRPTFIEGATTCKFSRGNLSVEFDRQSGAIVQVLLMGQPMLGPSASLFAFRMRLDQKPVEFGSPTIELRGPNDLQIIYEFGEKRSLLARFEFHRDADAVIVRVESPHGEHFWDEVRPDPGLNAALQAELRPGFASLRTHADSPYAIHEVSGSPPGKRKYPTADWMTSPQWFEELERPFTALTMVDLLDAGSDRGLLIAHDGSQQFFRDPEGVRCVITAYDPWDEGRYGCPYPVSAAFMLVPHNRISNAQRIKVSHGFAAEQQVEWNDGPEPVGGGTAYGVDVDIPESFGTLEVCNAPNVLAHAFFRESMKSGEGLPLWAGHRMFRDSQEVCDHPFVIRLVEWDGQPADVTLKLPGPIALAAKTNILGEVGEFAVVRDSGPTSTVQPDPFNPHPGPAALRDTRWLDVQHPVDPPEWARDAKLKGESISWSALRFTMRPREVATIYADLIMGRKQWRDLDAKRDVWAKVHKSV